MQNPTPNYTDFYNKKFNLDYISLGSNNLTNVQPILISIFNKLRLQLNCIYIHLFYFASSYYKYLIQYRLHFIISDNFVFCF